MFVWQVDPMHTIDGTTPAIFRPAVPSFFILFLGNMYNLPLTGPAKQTPMRVVGGQLQSTIQILSQLVPIPALRINSPHKAGLQHMSPRRATHVQ